MKTLALAAIILTSAALSSNAFARAFTIHGTICRPIYADRGDAEYDQYGVHNASTTDILTVECPLPIAYPDNGPPPVLTAVQTTVYDRSTSSDVYCLLQQVDMNGTVKGTASNKTFNLGPGSGPVNLGFDLSLVYGQDASGYWRLRCLLPAVESGEASYLTSTVVQTAE